MICTRCGDDYPEHVISTGCTVAGTRHSALCACCFLELLRAALHMPNHTFQNPGMQAMYRECLEIRRERKRVNA